MIFHIATDALAVKLIFTAFNLAGAVIIIRSLINAAGDYAYLMGSGQNGQLRIEAKGAVFSEVLRLCAVALFATLGLLSLITEAGPVLRAILPAGLTIATGVLVVEAFHAQRTRLRILRYRGIDRRVAQPDLYRE